MILILFHYYLYMDVVTKKCDVFFLFLLHYFYNHNHACFVFTVSETGMLLTYFRKEKNQKKYCFCLIKTLFGV